ncbi:hypothetical protein J1N35_044060 [Gossypium stocksii]|uniref:Retrotransposon gag domain-containing protein n=1 Tax=Gossypium stocksii TaxID=47602 RepID=A0A9D3U893_9ROSI|nr:hypothetical protein J1N35_044060 [Gossypium stocksii]
MATIRDLSAKVEELVGKLTLCQAAMGHAENEAQEKLHRFLQQGTIREYMKQFSELMLQITNLTKDEPNKKVHGGRDSEEERHSNDASNIDSSNEKPRYGKWRPNSPKKKRSKMRCFFCKWPHIKKDYPKVSSFSTIKRDNELKEAKPVERINLMILIPAKMNGREGLMFVDINIGGQKRSVLLIQLEAWSYKSTNGKARKILRKNIDSIKQSTMEALSKMLVAYKIDMRPVELTVELPPLGNVGCVLNFGGKVAIVLSFDLLDWQDRMALSKFLSKEVKGLWANRSQDVRIKRIPIGASDRSRGKGLKGRDNPIARLVGKEPRRRESSRSNQVSAILKVEQGRCGNGWGRMSRVKVQSP